MELDAVEIRRACRRQHSPTHIAHTLLVASLVLAFRRDVAAHNARHEDNAQHVGEAQHDGEARERGEPLGLDWLPEAECRVDFEARADNGAGFRKWVWKPDAYIGLHRQGREPLHLFVEADRGHVSRERFAERLRTARLLEASGLAREAGWSPFSLLCVTTAGARRAENLLAVAEAQDDAGRWNPGFACATWADVQKHGPLGAMWRAAGSDVPLDVWQVQAVRR